MRKAPRSSVKLSSSDVRACIWVSQIVVYTLPAYFETSHVKQLNKQLNTDLSYIPVQWADIKQSWDQSVQASVGG